MKAGWQAAAVLLACALVAQAQESAPAFAWETPKARAGLFKEIGMLDRERDEYATNLAVCAVNRVAAAKASAASLDEARRLLGTALQLSPRNRKALVAAFQLGKGIVPEPAEGDYSPPVFARLLLARGQLLEKLEGADNALLARVFIDLAAQLDPKNEEAAYFSEIRRLDHGPVDWKALTDGP
ncbi:MAG TPA: hypothetical protein VIM46_04545 [Luteolibacter sp.]